jgi:hypothetical protein
LLGVRGYKAGKPARITPRDLCRVVNPRRQPAAGNGLTSHCIRTQRMTSPYLNRPLFPLAVALPRMLGDIEAELAIEKLEAKDVRRLYRRAELIRELLAYPGHLARQDPTQGARRGCRPWCVGGRRRHGAAA